MSHPKTLKTDVLVVGSGFGALAPALRMAEAGHEVLVIEKGPEITPHLDFEQTQKPEYLLRYLKGIGSDTVSFTYAEGLGGGSGFFEMVTLRAPSTAFEQVDARGRRLWPTGIDRCVLDPYYDVGECMMDVCQLPSDQIPKTGVAFSNLMKRLGYSCDRARYALKSRCRGVGYCVSGCVYGAKKSLHYNYIKQAKEHGARFLCGLNATTVRPYRAVTATDVYRYRVSCEGNDGEVNIFAKTVVLAGGTVGTARLLLDSRRHFRSLSEHVGKNVAFNGSIKAVGLLPDGMVDGDMVTGISHCGMISYELFDALGITISAAKPKPLTLVTSARLGFKDDVREPRFWGLRNEEIMRNYRRRMIVLYSLGLTPPTAEIRSLGRGHVKPHLDLDDHLRSYHAEIEGVLHGILERNGCRVLEARRTDLEAHEYSDLHFDTAHMVGSCRMAERPEDGVVDADGQVFNYPGLYVSDGAAVPSSLAVNTALTILANAERIAARMVETSRSMRAASPSLTAGSHR